MSLMHIGYFIKKKCWKGCNDGAKLNLKTFNQFFNELQIEPMQIKLQYMSKHDIYYFTYDHVYSNIWH